MKRLVLFFAVTLLAASSLFAAAKSPNIVFILADDLGWSDTTLYGQTKLYQTPNLERVAARGMTFDRAYTVSDNGGNMYNEVDGTTTPTSNRPLRGGKGNNWDGGGGVAGGDRCGIAQRCCGKESRSSGCDGGEARCLSGGDESGDTAGKPEL